MIEVILVFLAVTVFFIYLAERPLENYEKMKILFYFLAMLSLFVTVIQASTMLDMEANYILTNRTISYDCRNQLVNHSIYNETGNLTGWEMWETPQCDAVETMQYNNTIDYSAQSGVLLSFANVFMWIIGLMLALMVVIMMFNTYKKFYNGSGGLFGEDE